MDHSPRVIFLIDSSLRSTKSDQLLTAITSILCGIQLGQRGQSNIQFGIKWFPDSSPAPPAGSWSPFEEFTPESCANMFRRVFGEHPSTSNQSETVRFAPAGSVSSALRELMSDYYFETWPRDKGVKKIPIDHRLFMISPCPWSLKELLQMAEGPTASFELLVMQTTYENIVERLRESVDAMVDGLQKHFWDRRMSFNWVDIRPDGVGTVAAGASAVRGGMIEGQPGISQKPAAAVSQAKVGIDFNWVGRDIINEVLEGFGGKVLPAEVLQTCGELAGEAALLDVLLEKTFPEPPRPRGGCTHAVLVFDAENRCGGLAALDGLQLDVYSWESSAAAVPDVNPLEGRHAFEVVGIIEQADFVVWTAPERCQYYCLPTTNPTNVAALSASLATIRRALLVNCTPLEEPGSGMGRRVLGVLYPLTVGSLGLRLVQPNTPFQPTIKVSFGNEIERTETAPLFLTSTAECLDAVVSISKIQGDTFTLTSLQSRHHVPELQHQPQRSPLQSQLDADLEVYLGERGIKNSGPDSDLRSRDLLSRDESVASTVASQHPSVFAGVVKKEGVFSIIQENYASILVSRDLKVTEFVETFQLAVEALASFAEQECPSQAMLLQFLRSDLVISLKDLERKHKVRTDVSEEILWSS